MAKRILTLALALLMVLALFSGCANTPASSQAPSSQAPAASSEEPKPTGPVFNETGYPIMSEPIEVTAFLECGATDFPDDPDQLATYKKLEEVTNIKINWEIRTDSESVNLYFTTGELADFFMSSVNATRRQQFGVEGGKFYDISKEMETLMPNMVSRFKEWPLMEKVIVESNGEIYGIPQIRLGNTAAGSQVFYRTDLLEKAGVKEPETIDEFYEALKACAEKNVTGGFAPICTYNGSHLSGNFTNYLYCAFGELTELGYTVGADNKVVYGRTTEQFKRTLEFVNRLYSEGLIEKEMFTMDKDAAIARGKANQCVFGTSNFSNVEPEDCLPNDGKVHVSMMYPLTSEWNSERHINAYNYLSVNGGCIKKDHPYAKAIMRLLDTAYADKEIVPGTGLIDLAWNLGIEGVTYEIKDDGTYSFLIPEGVKDEGWTFARHYGGQNVKIGVYDFAGLQSAPNAMAREIAMSTKNIPFAKDNFPAGFLQYTEDETNARATKATNIDKYANEMRDKFIMGAASIEKDWDAYVEEINKMGLEEVLKITQAAYDRFLAK